MRHLTLARGEREPRGSEGWQGKTVDTQQDSEKNGGALPVRIVADDREKGSGIPALLSGMVGVQVCMQRMETGDYLVAERVLVERKTLVDFAASIVDDRLFRQATRLTRSTCRPVLLIEGSKDDLGEIKMTRESMQGALIALSLVFDIPVLRSADIRESARLIAYAARQLKRVGTNTWAGSGRKPKSIRGKRLRLLQCLPGIGRERAGRLLAEFGSVEHCFRADVDALCGVPGIGRKTANAIREIVE